MAQRALITLRYKIRIKYKTRIMIWRQSIRIRDEGSLLNPRSVHKVKAYSVDFTHPFLKGRWLKIQFIDHLFRLHLLQTEYWIAYYAFM